MQAAASSVLPGTESGNLTLGDLALDAAIEIEKFESTGRASFVALKQLGQSLARSTNGDLYWFPFMTVLSPSAAAIITRHLRVIFTSVSVKSRSGWLLLHQDQQRI